ncbi:MAG: hypothetical protein HS113_08175 [Verrucomicrobiales bacterium]|nr:hypothetical protein [Verrucomicrobiales bacterium]
MSPSKIDTLNAFQPVTVASGQTRLLLSEQEVVIRKSGLEFLSLRPLPLWAEVTVDLQSPLARRPLRGSGVVVDCTGDRHTGYTISVLLLGLSAQSQQHLQELALASAT